MKKITITKDDKIWNAINIQINIGVKIDYHVLYTLMRSFFDDPKISIISIWTISDVLNNDGTIHLTQTIRILGLSHIRHLEITEFTTVIDFLYCNDWKYAVNIMGGSCGFKIVFRTNSIMHLNNINEIHENITIIREK